MSFSRYYTALSVISKYEKKKTNILEVEWERYEGIFVRVFRNSLCLGPSLSLSHSHNTSPHSYNDITLERTFPVTVSKWENIFPENLSKDLNTSFLLPYNSSIICNSHAYRPKKS